MALRPTAFGPLPPEQQRASQQFTYPGTGPSLSRLAGRGGFSEPQRASQATPEAPALLAGFQEGTPLVPEAETEGPPGGDLTELPGFRSATEPGGVAETPSDMQEGASPEQRATLERLTSQGPDQATADAQKALKALQTGLKTLSAGKRVAQETGLTATPGTPRLPDLQGYTGSFAVPGAISPGTIGMPMSDITNQGITVPEITAPLGAPSMPTQGGDALGGASAAGGASSGLAGGLTAGAGGAGAVAALLGILAQATGNQDLAIAAQSLGAGATIAGGAGAGLAAAAGTATPLVATGAALAPISAGAAIAALADMAYKLEAGATKERQAANVKRTMATVVPEILQNVPRYSQELGRLTSDPNATPEAIRQAYDRWAATEGQYNAYDNLFKSGRSYFIDLPQLAVAREQLKPYLQLGEYGSLQALDRLAGTPQAITDLPPENLGFNFGGPGFQEALRPGGAPDVSTGVLGTLLGSAIWEANPADPATPQDLALAGIDPQQVQRQLTKGDVISYLQNAGRERLGQPGSSSPYWLMPYGATNADLLGQVRGLEPGQAEMGLRKLLEPYGESSNPFFALGGSGMTPESGAAPASPAAAAPNTPESLGRLLALARQQAGATPLVPSAFQSTLDPAVLKQLLAQSPQLARLLEGVTVNG